MAKLKEKDFIHEPKKGEKLPLYIWFLVLILFALFGWIYMNYFRTAPAEKPPFEQVTNRQMSLFLWQNPEYMRPFHQEETGYLPGFYYDHPGMKPEKADDYAKAPPELFFRYHLWERLIKQEAVDKPVAREELVRFFQEVSEWAPGNWSEAPEGYGDFKEPIFLPLEPRIAFFAWKTLLLHEDAFNEFHPTKEQYQLFLQDHPHFARNYWQNTYPDYVVSEGDGEGVIPLSEMPLFLKLSLFQEFMFGRVLYTSPLSTRKSA